MNSKKQRKKSLIKKGLKQSRQGSFVVSEEECRKWWKHINDALFDGELNPPKEFVIKNFYKETWGWCKPAGHPKRPYREVRIGISSGLTTKSDFISTLIHEMVHQWEWEYFGEWDDNVGHGKNFFSWRSQIKRSFGITLSRCA